MLYVDKLTKTGNLSHSLCVFLITQIKPPYYEISIHLSNRASEFQ